MIGSERRQRILLPVRPWFIWLSLLAALMLNLLPPARIIGYPDFLALALAFWCVREPRRINIGTAWTFGFLMDIADAALLGQHALCYAALAYSASFLAKRLQWFPLSQQALHMLPLLFGTQVLMMVTNFVAGGMFPGWGFFLTSLTSALLWPVVSFLLLLPQRQPENVDKTRPI
jgi:rod shape-determining protein MreD